MLNYNGDFQDHAEWIFSNRAFLYGDSVFETIKVVNNEILFWEEHYLRLMFSMRILKIEIPNTFTPDYLENQIKNTNSRVSKLFSGRTRLTVFRSGGGLYTPKTNEASFTIKSVANPGKIKSKAAKANAAPEIIASGPLSLPITSIAILMLLDIQITLFYLLLS